MYRYDNIGFRPVDKTDLEKLRVFHNNADTNLYLGKVELFSQSEQIAWWESMSKSSTNRTYCIVSETYENIIGVMRTNSIDHVNKNVEIGVDIFPEYRDKGNAKKSYKMILEFLFNHSAMHTIYLRYISFNNAAEKLYESIGFKRTGLFPEYIFRKGKYYDYILMSMTVGDYRKIYGAKEE